MTSDGVRSEYACRLEIIAALMIRDAATLLRQSHNLLTEPGKEARLVTTLKRYSGERRQICGKEVRKIAEDLEPVLQLDFWNPITFPLVNAGRTELPISARP